MGMKRDKCEICKLETSKVNEQGHTICEPCQGKYGSWNKIKAKLESLGIKPKKEEEIGQEEIKTEIFELRFIESMRKEALIGLYNQVYDELINMGVEDPNEEIF